jgi:hypothetical protein
MERITRRDALHQRLLLRNINKRDDLQGQRYM